MKPFLNYFHKNVFPNIVIKTLSIKCYRFLFVNTQKTIVALATAPLPAGIAVIRISGPFAWNAAEILCPKLKTSPARTAIYTPIFSTTEQLDYAIVLGFKAPNSFTGENVVEVQCHGGIAIIQKIIDTILKHPHVKMAEAGEFSRQAVMNGKMDLTAAEGLADLIEAQTEEQRRQALRQLDGALGNQFENWRTEIMDLITQVEAGIDFPEEELDILKDANIKEKISATIKTLQQAIKSNAGERLRDGFHVVILGRPNAGKSTLTNLLTGKDTAIVSPVAGTTRDIVESHLNINGFPVILADTAGIRKSKDSIEKEGVKKASKQAAQADIVIAVIDANEWPNIDKDISPFLKKDKSFIIVSKIDENPVDVSNMISINDKNIPVTPLNLKKSESLVSITQVLEDLIKKNFAQSQQQSFITRKRHRTAIEETIKHLTRALNIIKKPAANISLTELLAQDLRSAANSIGKVTGHTNNEDVLDLVFSTFCIGK